MKKIVLYIATILTLCCWYTYAESKFTTIDMLLTDITHNMPKLSPEQQIITLNNYEESLSTIEIEPKTKKALTVYIRQKRIEANQKMKGITQKTYIKKKQNLDYTIPTNINREEIASYRLWLHNEKRIEKWLNILTYDKALEKAAYIRADTIKTEKRTINFHKREDSDNNYSNYQSMKKWFANVGIIFNGEWTEFSENIWRGLYNIKTNTLTEEIKKQILKTFTRFIKEESYNGAHYRAIVMPRYTKIWLWISLDPSTKKYYLVTHYSK